MSMAQNPTRPDATTTEALRRVVDAQIGPRRTGTLYENVDGAFEVLETVTDPARARTLLRRRCARWALVVRDVRREDGQPFVVGTAWTSSDRILRESGRAPSLAGAGAVR